MANNAAYPVCKNPECHIADTGQCLEGHELRLCPNYRQAPELPVEAPSTDDTRDDEGAERESLTLVTGGRLSIREAAPVLRAGDTRVVALVGPSDAGKTTLIASVYDLFQEDVSRAGDFRFAGSRTLPAFEQACHHARAASQRTEPDTERTSLGGEVEFLHLGLFDTTNEAALNLILADRAGEYYRSVSDFPSVAASFIEISRADTVTVLVDGRRLLDIGERHNLRNETELILQGLVDGDALGIGQRLAIVLTKLDEIEMSRHKARAEADFGSLEQSIRRLFGIRFAAVGTFRTAASPKTEGFQRGYGLLGLLQFWALPPIVPPSQPTRAAPPSRAISRIEAPGDS